MQSEGSECSSDVLLLLSESLRIYSGLLTIAVVSGVFFGLIAAVLLHVFLLKPFFLHERKFKGIDPWRLLEVEEADEETVESGSIERKTGHSETGKQTDPVNSDIAAFALKAKVVYPINQRYRPLADGASNPSLYEHPKPPALRDDGSTSSSGDDWLSLSHEEDESGHSPGHSTSTQPSPVFRRAECYLRTLCYPECEGRVSLLCLTLQNLYVHTAQLQQEKLDIFLQILGTLCNRENDLLNKQLQEQEKEVEQLRRGMPSALLPWEKKEVPGPLICSTEDVEKAGREKLEYKLHAALSFAKQLEKFCQNLHSYMPSDVSQKTACTLINHMLLLEEQLADIQAAMIKMLCDRLQWWEEFSGWLRIRTALLRQEVELRVKLTSHFLEELTVNGHLGFGHMEKLVSDLRTSMSEELQHCSDEIRQQTVELVYVHCRKLDVRMRKMKKSQRLDSYERQQQEPPQVVILMELQAKHWKQRIDFDLQQDRRVSDGVCDLWKKLFCHFSGRFRELWRESIMDTLTACSALSVEQCQSLLHHTELTLASEVQHEESHTHQQLHVLTHQLQQAREAWAEEEALAETCLKHLGSQHMKVVMAMVFRQRDIQESGVLIKEKQRLLVVEIQRIFAGRHFYNHIVKEMKLTQLKLQPDPQNLQQELLSELETASEILQGHAQFLIGHALANSVRLRLVALQPSNMATADDTHKEQLKQAMCESVHVTHDSVAALIRNYYSQIQTIITAMQHSHHQHNAKVRERQRKRRECVRTLQRELFNWARKPHSAEFHKRVELQKRRCLTQYEEEWLCEDKGETVDLQQHSHVITEQLREAEDSFLSRLAALTRVPLIDIPTNNLAGAQMGVLPLKIQRTESPLSKPFLSAATYRSQAE